MLKPSFQWRRSEGRIMELVPSGSGAQAPGQFRMTLRYKPQAPSPKLQATSAKPQAPSTKLQASRPDYLRLKKNEKKA